ncbi:MAG TPA: YlmH/Sll1252 family protein [Bacillota bacterium]|jgi:RNA-binding protein YlmH|nr:YlmH/Sll1252 family protein [Bacillota bacterium]HOL09782.1 YlmH/Sll1252 family protein [Bacillota bacterium]HPO97328.1 YlmH/Sll1252 family protein [Bacillota bacterium]
MTTGTSSPGNEIKLLLAKINDLAEQSLRDQTPKWTDFLDPNEREQAEAVLRAMVGVRFSAYGGYQQSERRRLVIYPDYYLNEMIEPELSFIEVVPNRLGNEPASPLSHRDYLGAILGLGINRSKIGDLLVSDNGCQFILVPELQEFIEINLEKVANYKVTLKVIDSEQLNLPERRTKEIKTTVASLRLDALAALGFGDSRTKMSREIKAEKVKVNWKTVKSPDLQLNPGDIISIRGRGRVEFREVTGKSKKGRIGIVLIRQL